MTIVTRPAYKPSLYVRKVDEVAQTIETAIADEECVDTHLLAYLIVDKADALAAIEHETHHSDDLERIHKFINTVISRELDEAGDMSPAVFDDICVTTWAADLSSAVCDELARGTALWRDDLGHDRVAATTRETRWNTLEAASAPDESDSSPVTNSHQTSWSEEVTCQSLVDGTAYKQVAEKMAKHRVRVPAIIGK